MFSAIPLLITLLLSPEVPREPLPTLRSLDAVTITEVASDERTTILIIVAAQRLRLTKAWELAIRESVDSVEIIRIADLKPNADLETVRRKLERRLPKEIDLLLDVGGSWAEALELDADEPNLLLLGSDRSVSPLVSGRFSPERLERLLSALAGREE